MNTTEQEDIIEDVTEEQLIANEELEQDTPEEVSEEQEATFDDSIKSILLGEKKKYKKEEDDEDEDEEEEYEDDMDEMKSGNFRVIKLSKVKGIPSWLKRYSGKEISLKSMYTTIRIDDFSRPVYVKAYFGNAKTGKSVDDDEPDTYDDIDEKKLFFDSAYYAKSDNAQKKRNFTDINSKSDLPEGKEYEDDMDEMEHGDKDMKKKKKEESKKKVSEALDLLLQNESELSEDFKSEASTLFEATIAERSVEIQEKLEEKYNSQLNEEVESIRESLIERIDDYLSYVVESWMDENTEQVENTLRTQIAENFITSLKDVFVENYIEVPAEKQDLVEELSNVAEESNEKLENAETEIASLQEKVQEFERTSVIADLSEDLSETESHKFKSILEGVEFGSKESFERKASVIKDSIFEGVETETTNKEEEYSSEDTEIIIEGEEDEKEKVPAHMRQYVDALSKK